MPWSGGSYTKGNNATGGWTGDASLGIGIEAGRHDTQDNDFATGINQCLNKDGSNAATGPLNAGGFKLTNVAVGTASTDAITLGQAQGGIDVQSITLSVDNTQFSNDSTPGEINLRKSRGAAVGTNTIVQNSDFLGALRFWGATGSGYAQGAAISAIVDSTPGAGTDMPTALQFFTSPDGTATPTERMRITNNGSVGIKTSTPQGELDVRTFYNDEDFVVGKVISGNYYLASKLIARHTTASAANVFIDTANNVIVRSTSSVKYKTDIVDYTRGLNAVATLRPVFYKGINDGEKQFAGLIAEEVHEAGLFEFVVYDADNKPDALHYGNMVALAVKAIQELNAKVEALKARVAELEGA